MNSFRLAIVVFQLGLCPSGNGIVNSFRLAIIGISTDARAEIKETKGIKSDFAIMIETCMIMYDFYDEFKDIEGKNMKLKALQNLNNLFDQPRNPLFICVIT